MKEEDAQMVPSKVVFTTKSDPEKPSGKKTACIVRIWKFRKERRGPRPLASGVDITSLRVSLCLAIQHACWDANLDTRYQNSVLQYNNEKGAGRLLA